MDPYSGGGEAQRTNPGTHRLSLNPSIGEACIIGQINKLTKLNIIKHSIIKKEKGNIDPW